MRYWRDLTYPEVSAWNAEQVVALLPVGATEAHGPHLPLDTDCVIAEGMALRSAARLEEQGWSVVILPTLAYTPAPFARGFAGTLSLSADTAQAVLVDLGQGLIGRVRALAIANAHLDPTHLRALEAGVQQLRQAGLTVAFPNLVRRRLAQRLGPEFLSGACHAGRYEGSLVLACQPERVRSEVAAGLAPNPASLSEAIGQGLDSFEAAGGPQAYFGDPAAASAPEGHIHLATLADILVEELHNALAG